MIKYSVVVPVYNEESVVKESYSRLSKVMKTLDGDYELIFVNDGSTDLTANIIKELYKNDSKVKLLNFSRNFGHQIAITAGIEHSVGDAVVIIDADLQDPPEAIIEMVKKWKEGFQVVYGKRSRRKGETFFKKITAFVFYRLLKILTSIDIPLDAGDFRLIDSKVRDSLKLIGEKNRFLRGLISWVGFKQTYITYIREERFAGETKYPIGKMIKFALDAITSFSYKPLKLASYLGFILSFISFFYLAYIIYLKIFTAKTIIGWTSILAVNLFFNGVMLIIIGIIGEYIGRIYDEIKNRPLYILQDKIGF